MPRKETKKKKSERLDTLLVEKGFAKSRERARALILAGSVLVNEIKIDKAGTRVKTDSTIRLLKKDHNYVSRGALKLIGALDSFKINPKGFTAIDAGSSTGGFSQVLLERGAKRIYAVDVGYGILDLKIKNDERVITLEKTNVRNLTKTDIAETADLITVDLSFISLKLVIPVLVNFLKKEGMLLALIKPQFEVGKQDVEKGGLVTDTVKHKRVIEEICAFCKETSLLEVLGTRESKLKGVKGNLEFFILCKRKD